MGVTNSHSVKAQIPADIWNKIVVDVKKIFANLPEKTPKKGIPGDGDEILKLDDQKGNPPIANEEEIFFNGAGFPDADHETFMFKPDAGFRDFCKTARKPYDLAVQAVLLIAKYHAGSKMSFGSDGDPYEWQAAVDLVNQVCGINFRDPAVASKFVGNDDLIHDLCIPTLKGAGDGEKD